MTLEPPDFHQEASRLPMSDIRLKQAAYPKRKRAKEDLVNRPYVNAMKWVGWCRGCGRRFVCAYGDLECYDCDPKGRTRPLPVVRKVS